MFDRFSVSHFTKFTKNKLFIYLLGSLGNLDVVNLIKYTILSFLFYFTLGGKVF